MISRKFLPVVAACALALVAGATSVAKATTAHASATSFCSGTGAIPAADLASPVSVSGCYLQGRLVVRSEAGSHIAVHVPAPGHAQAAQAITTFGDFALTVTNKAGRVTATTSLPTASRQTRTTAADAAATDPACNELAVAYLGFVWDKTLKWYYNQSTVSRAGLNGPTTLTDIRAANTNITQGINNCGWSENGFGSYLEGEPPLGAYQGTTSKYANVGPDAECTSNFPDGQNTVSWGPFNSDEADTLALTCFEWDTEDPGGFAVEADTYLGSNRNLVTTFPMNCTNSYDLETIMTHEWGHAYGLDHETADPDEVMYEYSPTCANRRHLGHGDYAGMANLYGAK